MARKAKNTPTTLVTFLLDRSGSMGGIKAATIEGFNAYLASLKGQPDTKIEFTFLQFDWHHGPQIDKIHIAEPIGQVPELTNDTYHPRGGTPLVEAAFRTIEATEKALEKRADKPQIVMCFQTDGYENQSAAQYTWEALNALVKRKTEEGWQFNFMGAGIDAYDQGAKMGIMAESTVSYDAHDIAATANAFRGTGLNQALYASGAAMNTQYTVGQKVASGDRFDPALNVSQSNNATLDVTKGS